MRSSSRSARIAADKLVFAVVFIAPKVSPLGPHSVAIERPTLRGGGLHPDGASGELPAIHRSNGDGGFGLVSHLDKAEAARATVEAVAHDFGALHRADFGKGCT